MSRLPATAAAALLVLTLGACRVAYVPSAEPATVDPASTDEAALRALVDVIPQDCNDSAARGIVRNGSRTPLRVVVQVGWSTPALEQVTGEVPVDVAAEAEVAFEVPAPPGARAQFGCQAYAKSIEPVP